MKRYGIAGQDLKTMLTQINIYNLTTIEALELHLNSGCTMITGETGAGKSVFIEAIELALGGRASSHILRPGKEKLDISLCFDLSNFPHIIEHLKQLDLHDDTTDCIIRRVITQDGRSRCYINGLPITLQLAKELGELLFHLHSQHEQHILIKADTQREILDRYAGHLPLLNQVKTQAESYYALLIKIKLLQEQMHERKKRSDYLRFQLDELDKVDLKLNEWEHLERDHKRLTHAEDLMRDVEQAILQIKGEDHEALLFGLKKIRKTFEGLKSIEPKALEWISIIDASLVQLEELTSVLKHYLNKLEYDPKRLREVEERISQIFNLSRKHQISPESLLSFREELTKELESLQSTDQSILALEKERNHHLKTYEELAKTLSENRGKAAFQLEREITETIRSLSLPYSEFHILLEKYPAREDLTLSPYGNEKIIFLIKTNPDQPLQSLNKCLSGGELSRLSLAAHLALASHASIPILIFDEIDTGLSGKTAEKIGKLLRKLGSAYQVFCITHKPQVAALGHHHLYVEKYVVEDSTYTHLHLLNEEEKTKEIARLLGGEKITEKTLAHAEEVLQKGIC